MITHMDAAEAVLAKIDEHGWAQGLINLIGCSTEGKHVCAAIAFRMAAQEWNSLLPLREQPVNRNAFPPTLKHLHERLTQFAKGSVPSWNDSPSTTEEDVRLAIKSLAAELDGS